MVGIVNAVRQGLFVTGRPDGVTLLGIDDGGTGVLTKWQNARAGDIGILQSMLDMRAFEERAAQQYQMGKIGGFCHLYIGQEAVVAGSFAAIRPDDYVITAYRDHAHALGRGTSMNACMAELFGKATGCSKGLGGSMHFFDKERFMFGGHAIVGAHIPLATGLAFASKYRREDRVTLCYFGDGAIHQGSFHEAFNLASLWELPVLLICENNGYAMGTSVHRSTALEELHHRGAGYNMAHSAVDGMDVRAVRDAVSHIVADMRAAVRQGLADYVPMSIARVPALMAIGRIKVDVAFIQVSLPDEFGYVSLGVSVDIIPAAVAKARLVIAEGKASASFVIAEVTADGSMQVAKATHIPHEGDPFGVFRQWYRENDAAD